MEDILQRWNIQLEEAKQSQNLATIELFLKYPNIDGFFELHPENRKVEIKNIFQNQFSLLKKEFKLKNIKIKGKRKEPRIIETQIALKDIFILKEKNYVKSLLIQAIEGVDSKVIEEDKKITELFYAVKARFGILIEGQISGLQGYEERIVL